MLEQLYKLPDVISIEEIEKQIDKYEYSLDGKTFKQIGTANYKMRFDYRRLFMGTRYAAFYYPTKTTGGQITVGLKN